MTAPIYIVQVYIYPGSSALLYPINLEICKHWDFKSTYETFLVYVIPTCTVSNRQNSSPHFLAWSKLVESVKTLQRIFHQTPNKNIFKIFPLNKIKTKLVKNRSKFYRMTCHKRICSLVFRWNRVGVLKTHTFAWSDAVSFFFYWNFNTRFHFWCSNRYAIQFLFENKSLIARVIRFYQFY